MEAGGRVRSVSAWALTCSTVVFGSAATRIYAAVQLIHPSWSTAWGTWLISAWWARVACPTRTGPLVYSGSRYWSCGTEIQGLVRQRRRARRPGRMGTSQHPRRYSQALSQPLGLDPPALGWLSPIIAVIPLSYSVTFIPPFPVWTGIP